MCLEHWRSLTTEGLFCYTGMPVGISSATGIFQRTMDNLMQGIRDVAVYMHDILVTGKTDEQPLKTLEEVHGRLMKAGMWAHKAVFS